MTTPAPDRRRPAPPAADDGVLDELVLLVAESYGYTCRPTPRDGMLLDGPHRMHVGMRNLRQLARQVSRDDWPALVADHVSTIITAIEEPLDLSDFSLVRGLLRARVYPADADTGRLISRPFAPGLIEAIVADTPTTVRTVVSDDAVTWPVPEDQLFAAAREGVRGDGPLGCEPLDDESGIRVLEGQTFYAATHLLWLDRYFDIGPAGALAVAPHRSTVAAYPIQGGSAISAAERLHAFAQTAYDEGPGSLTPELYWWQRGTLTLLETRRENGRLVLPAEFLIFLAEL